MPITKATPDDSGCYVDGHWGQYAVAHMVQRAQEFGYGEQDLPGMAEVIALADRKMDECVHGGITCNNVQPLTDEEDERLTEASDEVEDWLNYNVAPEGYSFGWHDGEFFLWPEETWEE